MNSINQVCKLNNEGVSLLVEGESSRAIGSFQSAVALLKQALSSCEPPNEVCSSAEISLKSVHHASTSILRESSSIVPNLQSLECYVYDRALLLEETDCDNVNEISPLYGAVLLFNLALAAHFEGRRGRDRSLKRASLLYRMCLQLLDDAAPQDSLFIAVLTVLALNNQAQIHYDLCDYNESRQCLGKVSNIMTTIEDVQFTLNRTDVEGLLLNVVALYAPTGAQAA
jgi:hypothetical protein